MFLKCRRCLIEQGKSLGLILYAVSAEKSIFLEFSASESADKLMESDFSYTVNFMYIQLKSCYCYLLALMHVVKIDLYV